MSPAAGTNRRLLHRTSARPLAAQRRIYDGTLALQLKCNLSSNQYNAVHITSLRQRYEKVNESPQQYTSAMRRFENSPISMIVRSWPDSADFGVAACRRQSEVHRTCRSWVSAQPFVTRSGCNAHLPEATQLRIGVTVGPEWVQIICVQVYSTTICPCATFEITPCHS
jgi:hypothetical protein